MGGRLPAVSLVCSALSLKQIIYGNCLEVGMLSFLFIYLAPDHSECALKCVLSGKQNKLNLKHALPNL